ncbi:MAG: hypothetical protein ACU0CB_04115 [Roseovarius sp.]|uniref:hypothetical protein n=1 Tax=Roseovarius sp. TaxID=1486281 RepID=UPI0040591906
MNNPFPHHIFKTQTHLDTYEHALHVAQLIRAVEMLAEATPILQDAGAPPIHYLLSVACNEMNDLAGRLSD